MHSNKLEELNNKNYNVVSNTHTKKKKKKMPKILQYGEIRKVSNIRWYASLEIISPQVPKRGIGEDETIHIIKQKIIADQKIKIPKKVKEPDDIQSSELSTICNFIRDNPM